jgi:hypothetical protein
VKEEIMIRTVIWSVHFAAVALALYLAAALLPGDNVNVNVLGALFLLAVVAIVDVVLTAPLKYLAGRGSRSRL